MLSSAVVVNVRFVRVSGHSRMTKVTWSRNVVEIRVNLKDSPDFSFRFMSYLPRHNFSMSLTAMQVALLYNKKITYHTVKCIYFEWGVSYSKGG